MSKILSLVGGKDCKEVTQKKAKKDSNYYTTLSFPYYSLELNMHMRNLL